MRFHGDKSSFNFYRKDEEHDDHNSQCQAEREKIQNMLSENSNHTDQNYVRVSSCSGDNQISDARDESQEYHCITCNRTYDGLIKCRHNDASQFNSEQRIDQQQNKMQDSDAKLYSCPYLQCQKRFNLESGLVRHKVVHTGQKPYSCDYQNCSQSFNQKSNLNRHKKIHKNQKPFICQKCCKSFTTTTNLKQHAQVHISKKQQRKHFLCQIKGCNKKYLYRCNLKKHKQEHEDPVGGCLLDQNQNTKKNIKKAKFEISLNQCNITLHLREASIDDHSEMKITYDQSLAPNAQIYNPIIMLPNEQKQVKQCKIENEEDDEIIGQEQKIEETLVRNLEEFFITKPSEISTSFYIHPDLMQYSRTVIGQVITLLEEKGTKEIRFFVETKQDFAKCVSNILEIYFGSTK